MTLSSIIHKETSKDINILWTNCDNSIFKNFLQRTLKCNLIEFDDTYFGSYDIDIVLCNNRIIYLDKCIESCKFFHCPLLIVDHDTKRNISIDTPFVISPVFQIATNNTIHDSWGNIADIVLPFAPNDSDLTTEWLKILNNLKRKSLILL